MWNVPVCVCRPQNHISMSRLQFSSRNSIQSNQIVEWHPIVNSRSRRRCEIDWPQPQTNDWQRAPVIAVTATTLTHGHSQSLAIKLWQKVDESFRWTIRTHCVDHNRMNFSFRFWLCKAGDPTHTQSNLILCPVECWVCIRIEIGKCHLMPKVQIESSTSSISSRIRIFASNSRSDKIRSKKKQITKQPKYSD